MEEKPAELLVSEQETQIQAPSFLDKLKIHKFKILGSLLGVLVFAGAVFGAYKFGQRQTRPVSQLTPTPLPSEVPSPPEEITNCKVERGHDREAEKKFHKVVVSKVKWDNYNNFSVKEVTIHYGYGPSPIFDEGPLTKKLISRDGKTLITFRTNDPREEIIMCEIGASCPLPRFLEEDEQTIINSLAFYLVTSESREFVEANDIKFIEFYEREKLPEWAFPEGKTFPGYSPGELLLRIDLSECMKKFCDEVALENDPSCVGEYYSPITIIKGKIIDHLGNPVSKAHIDFTELTAKGCTGSSYTDENGDFIISECYQPPETKLKEGVYALHIYPPSVLNLESEYKEINLKKGETKIVNINLK